MRTAALMKGDSVLAESVELASCLRDRLRGLLGRDSLAESRAMYLVPCNSIHTFFMRFNLDLLFLDRNLVVVKIVRNLRPGRIVSGGIRSAGVIELQSGWLPEDAVGKGDQLLWSGKE